MRNFIAKKMQELVFTRSVQQVTEDFEGLHVKVVIRTGIWTGLFETHESVLPSQSHPSCVSIAILFSLVEEIPRLFIEAFIQRAFQLPRSKIIVFAGRSEGIVCRSDSPIPEIGANPFLGHIVRTERRGCFQMDHMARSQVRSTTATKMTACRDFDDSRVIQVRPRLVRQMCDDPVRHVRSLSEEPSMSDSSRFAPRTTFRCPS
jgi:hypothetical protein